MPLDVTTILGVGEAVSCLCMSWCADGDAASMGGNPPVVLRIAGPDILSVFVCLLSHCQSFIWLCIRGFAASLGSALEVPLSLWVPYTALVNVIALVIARSC